MDQNATSPVDAEKYNQLLQESQKLKKNNVILKKGFLQVRNLASSHLNLQINPGAREKCNV